MAKVANLKFGTHAPRQSPVMTPEKIREKGAGQGHVTLNFLGVKCQQLENGLRFKL